MKKGNDMKVYHFGGAELCATISELNSILAKRYGNDSNEFWIHKDNSKCPYLGIMVKKEYAYVQYIPNEEEPGYASIGSCSELESGETTVFYTNNINDELEVINDSVIYFSLAQQAAE